MTGETREDSVLGFLKNAETLLVAVILAIILWVGQTTYSNSLVLTKLTEKVDHLVNSQSKELSQLQRGLERHGELFDTIWPRLREMKERIQHLENISKDARSNSPWKH